VSEGIFRANNLSFQKNRKVILDNVSFEVQQGQFSTLIGPNGAGKSTLLKLMLGLEHPTGGSVHWEKAMRIGYMPQSINFDVSFPLSVGQLFDLKPGSVDHHDRVRIETLTQTHSLTDKFIFDLSGGELQRVLLTYALLGNPDILVLDEPMQGLDLDAEALFLDILQTLKYDYLKTIFMVSHDLHMVFKHSDHVICLQRHVCCQGAPATIQADPAYNVLFGQRKDSLMALYAHQHDHIHGDGCSHD
jgi:zinc transport system ATP-binding protein